MNSLGFYEGIPVFIATKEFQRRKHHKKRINKKWRKRYGVKEVNSLRYGQVIITSNAVYMTKKTFEDLKVSHAKSNITLKGE